MNRFNWGRTFNQLSLQILLVAIGLAGSSQVMAAGGVVK